MHNNMQLTNLYSCSHNIVFIYGWSVNEIYQDESSYTLAKPFHIVSYEAIPSIRMHSMFMTTD